MTFSRAGLVAGLLLAATSVTLNAADFSPAVVFNNGSKFDNSHNQAVYHGLERFKNRTGIRYREFEITNNGSREEAFRLLAEGGADIIISSGFSVAGSMETVAREFPNTKFTIIDAVVDLPNVQSVIFKEHEGSFLVGLLAAMKSQSNMVGFIGGMDMPLIRRYACGYEQGAKHAKSTIGVLQNMTGTTPLAWNNPARGTQLAEALFDRGVDVVYSAAAGTSAGVYQAAKVNGKLAIGVDTNQNHLHPGSMLTSMLKRFDIAAENAFNEARNGTWKPGFKFLGLAEAGVGWALDEHNSELITEEMKAAAVAASEAIASGKIQVHDYMTDNACTY